MSVVCFVLGFCAVGVVALDIFHTVIVPRPTGRRWRPSAFLTRFIWYGWRAFGHRRVSDERREDFLGAFAPFALVALLVVWIASLITAYGSMFYALREQIKPVPSFLEALYFAGTSLLTIGYGDYAPHGFAVRLLSLFTGASGLGAFAIITAFLFAVFGSYQQREAFVVMFTNRAGAPPSGVDVIETHQTLGSVESLVTTMREAQLWLAAVLETHLAYPILTYFRSTHEGISWVAVVGAILDASTLAVTTLDVESKGEAILVNRLARHFVSDFSDYFGFTESDGAGIERGEFDAAYQRLHEAGLPLLDRESAWRDFSAARAGYAGRLNAMAQYWRIPPAQWIGDRSLLAHHAPYAISPADVAADLAMSARRS